MAEAAAERIYCGVAVGRVTTNDGPGTTRPLEPRLDLRNHSPTGFGWGYAGSGPAQLALAMLADALGDDARALDLYQAFKFGVVAKFGRRWQLSRRSVLATVRELEERKAVGNYEPRASA